jgi:hypothetical protein
MAKCQFLPSHAHPALLDLAKKIVQPTKRILLFLLASHTWAAVFHSKNSRGNPGDSEVHIRILERKVPVRCQSKTIQYVLTNLQNNMMSFLALKISYIQLGFWFVEFWNILGLF